MLYLVQHGIAHSQEEDPERPLTEQGRVETAAVASFLGRERPLIGRIVHSDRRRARQTARIIARRLGVDAETVVEGELLGPTDDPAAWADRLVAASETMLVGHLPHLSRLAGQLLSGDPDRCPVRFRNSGILCLGRREEGEGWEILWYLTPDLVPVGTA